MNETFLVMDIETVPDLTVWQPAAPGIEKIQIDSKPAKASLEFLQVVIGRIKGGTPTHQDDIDKAHDIARRADMKDELGVLEEHILPEQQKSEFAPVYAQAPVAIGCVWLDFDLSVKKVGCLKIQENKTLLEGEPILLAEWNDFMASKRPTIVTWNGRGFDLPALMLRSFRHGLNLNWYFGTRDYRYRYSEEKHLDLMDAMADYGAVRSMKLDAIATLAGLPGKHDDMDGSKVAGMFDEGRIAEIAQYCTSDTVQTAFVFMRWRLIKGQISLEMYRDAVSTLLQTIEKEPATERLHSLINKPSLLLQP